MIKETTETLSKAFYEVSEKYINKTQAAGAPGQGFEQGGNDDANNNASQGGKDNVYDADYKVVDDDKK